MIGGLWHWQEDGKGGLHGADCHSTLQRAREQARALAHLRMAMQQMPTGVGSWPYDAVVLLRAAGAAGVQLQEGPREMMLAEVETALVTA